MLLGIRNVEDVKDLLGFFEASPKERDDSVLGTFTPGEAVENCVYCNHCQRCPAGLNVGLINKYYDLAVAGDSMAAGHYLRLQSGALSITKVPGRHVITIGKTIRNIILL